MTGKYIFNIMNAYLIENGISWKSCVGICTHGTPSIVVTLKGFVSYVKKENTNIITTHCFIDRESLVVNTLGVVLKNVFVEVVGSTN